MENIKIGDGVAEGIGQELLDRLAAIINAAEVHGLGSLGFAAELIKAREWLEQFRKENANYNKP